MTSPVRIPGFRSVPFTGVIYVMAEAARQGYRHGHPDWCNLGQGMPETGPLPGAPPRVQHVDIEPRRPGVRPHSRDLGAPAGGGRALQSTLPPRPHVAVHRAQRLHLRRRPRLAHPRRGRAGPRQPRPFPARLHGVRGAARHLQGSSPRSRSCSMAPRATTSASTSCGARSPGRGLSALLLSNPCNPTGKVIRGGEELEAWVAMARELQCSLLIDEFYSHYVWADGRRRWSPPRGTSRTSTRIRSCCSTGSPRTGAIPAGAAPGSWVRRQVIEAVSSSGSFLDGGGSKPLQRSAVPLLASAIACGGDGGDPSRVPSEACRSSRRAASRPACGSTWSRRERSTAGPISQGCRSGINDGMTFFRAALERQGDLRPGRVLRREPRQAAERPAVAVPAATCGSQLRSRKRGRSSEG